MGKIVLALKQIISFFGRTICVLPEEHFFGSFPEEGYSG